MGVFLLGGGVMGQLQLPCARMRMRMQLRYFGMHLFDYWRTQVCAHEGFVQRVRTRLPQMVMLHVWHGQGLRRSGYASA